MGGVSVIAARNGRTDLVAVPYVREIALILERTCGCCMCTGSWSRWTVSISIL